MLRMSTVLDNACISIEETAPRNFDNLEDWASACGVQKADGVQLITESADVADNGVTDINVGIMTTQNIAAGQPVLFVPNDMIISASKVREEFGIDRSAETLLGRLGKSEDLPQYYLMLKILSEYEKGEASPYFPWLNGLPRYFSNGSSMTHFCCTKLLPPLVGKLANRERIRFTYFYKALQDSQVLDNGLIKTNKALAKWAFAIVFTRCFPFGETDGGDSHIIPIADYFNHGTYTEVEMNVDKEGNCFVYSTRDVPAGSPLRISYGEPTNPSFLFARYGFLDESSPATFCKIMIPDHTPELINMGCDHSKMLFYKDTGEVSEEVWDVLLYRILGDTDRDTQQTLYNAHMTGDYETKQQIHEYYYPQTYAALQDHITSFLKDLDQLTEKAAGRNQEIHPRIPLVMRHNDFVRQTFLRVQQRLQTMGSL